MDSYEPKTEFGRKLLKLRQQYADKGGKFLNRVELDDEIRARKGETWRGQSYASIAYAQGAIEDALRLFVSEDYNDDERGWEVEDLMKAALREIKEWRLRADARA